jgi:signal peptidase II
MTDSHPVPDERDAYTPAGTTNSPATTPMTELAGSSGGAGSLWFVSAGVLALDQATKWLIRTIMEPGDSFAVMGNWLRITSVRNPGGAFGLRWGHVAVYYAAALLVSLWIIRQIARGGYTRRLSVWALALILGGAIGNLTDRVIHGEVTDFIDVEFVDMTIPAFDFVFIHHPGYAMDRWPTFNVADSAVSVGIVLLLLSLWYDPVVFGRHDRLATAAVADNPHFPPIPVADSKRDHPPAES